LDAITGIHEAPELPAEDFEEEEPGTVTSAIDALNKAQDKAYDKIHQLCASLDALWEG